MIWRNASVERGTSRRPWRSSLSTPALVCCLLTAVASCAPPSTLKLVAEGGASLAFYRVEATVISADRASLLTDEPIFDTLPGTVGCHSASVVAFADGELLAAWYAYEGPYELDGSAIYMSRRPAGQGWSTPTVLVDHAEGDGNPVLYAEGDRVWLFQAVVPARWSTSRIEMRLSEDRGATWSAPTALDGPLGANVKYPPVRLASGELLLPAYDDLIQRSLFFVSSDGLTWTLRSSLFTAPPNQNLQPALAVLDDGRLLGVMRNSGGGWLWATTSDDDGRTWSTPWDSGFPNPGSAAQLLRLTDGKLLLLFNDSDTQRNRLSAALSVDDGRTWPVQCVLADGDGRFSYPFAVQDADGGVFVLYTRDREQIHCITLDAAWFIEMEDAL